MLDIVLSIPDILPRLLALLPYCSPINDLILLLLRISAPPSPLHSSIIPQALNMLDPDSDAGEEGHVAVDELLRGIIEFCSAAPSSISQGPPGNGQTTTPSQLPAEEEAWRENGLARQIASGQTVKIMMKWMLEGTEYSRRELDQTPRLGGVRRKAGTPESTTLRTSSLLESISVLIDLIRKNNSDFVEHQTLAWARRKEFVEGSQELTGDIELDIPQEREKDRGPCLLDLSEMLEVIASQLGGFEELMRNPRSLVSFLLPSARNSPLISVDECVGGKGIDKYRENHTSHSRTISNMRTLRRTPSLFEYEFIESTYWCSISPVRFRRIPCWRLATSGQIERCSVRISIRRGGTK